MHITSPLKSRTTNAITAYGIRDLISLYCTRGKNIFCYCISDEFIFSVGKDFGIDYFVHELELVEMPRLSENKLHMLFARWMIAGENYIYCPSRQVNDTEDLHTPVAIRSNDVPVDLHTPVTIGTNAVSVDLSSTGDEDEVSDQSFLDVDEDEVREDEDIETVMTPVSC